MITLEHLTVGKSYERPELARMWGYKGWQALGKGIVTPSGKNLIILFVTKEKQSSLTQYEDYFENDLLHMEGEENHQNDVRLAQTIHSNDEVYLFY
jgi:putative restriction endonuclease